MNDIYSLLDKMAFYEEKIMELYWSYAKRFPEKAGNWDKLAEEEKDHAHMIRGITNSLESEELLSGNFKVHISQVEAAISGIQRHIIKSLEPGLTMEAAIKTAVEIEKGMLESGVFTMFRTNDPKLSKVLKKLIDDTKSHFESLKSFNM